MDCNTATTVLMVTWFLGFAAIVVILFAGFRRQLRKADVLSPRWFHIVRPGDPETEPLRKTDDPPTRPDDESR